MVMQYQLISNNISNNIFSMSFLSYSMAMRYECIHGDSAEPTEVVASVYTTVIVFLWSINDNVTVGGGIYAVTVPSL